MKHCRNCGQHVAEKIITCPSCGSDTIDELKKVDDYLIDRILHEGHGTILCRAVKTSTGKPALIRIFKPGSGIDEKIADRLGRELEKLKTLPPEHFVRHYEICRSSEGLWYRVSEWNRTLSWGSILSSGRLQDLKVAIDLFINIAEILDILHKTGHTIPHLILDDIIVMKDRKNGYDVKIDYKLSRFINPLMDRPGPMLKKLLSCHPDILNNRPFDIQSDVWSLGKIFVELLSGDHQTLDFHEKIDTLPLPEEIQVLFRIMLAEDPDLRPRSMAQVVRTLMRITDADFKAAERSHKSFLFGADRAIHRLKTKLSLITAATVFLAVAGGITWFNLPVPAPSDEKILENFANQYAGSVAFLMADYQLTLDKTVVYENRVEGTAFLADPDGYLLTNRHVACPWLEDHRLHFLINHMKDKGKSPELTYTLYLWFEGARAFKRPPEAEAVLELEDFYHLDSAFRTGGVPRLEIAGVARPPSKTRQLVKSPLKDDFAVLKIEQIPEGITAIPMRENLDLRQIGRLAPVITLGFPLGHQTQEAFVNTSVTRGHIRRTFEDLLQVDTSIHSGNSGGPLIDTSGQVIGIASRVAMSWTKGPIPFATQLPDMGFVLPINKAASFITDLKSGKAKWRGDLDLYAQVKIEAVKKLIEADQWEKAAETAKEELRTSSDVRLIIAAGMTHFFINNKAAAAAFFEQALSMSPENMMAGYMRYLIDWFSNAEPDNRLKNRLLTLDWRSPMEFFGYLARMLDSSVHQAIDAPSGYYSLYEKSWILYTMALIHEKAGRLEDAETLLKRSVMIAGCEEWLYYLALVRLKMIWRRQAMKLPENTMTTPLNQGQTSFLAALKQRRSAQVQECVDRLSSLSQLEPGMSEPEKKLVILEKLQEEMPENYHILASKSVYKAMSGQWEQSLDDCRKFIQINGREDANRLLVGLLIPQILQVLGKDDEAGKAYEKFIQNTKDAWYQKIAACLTGKITPARLAEEAGTDPAYVVTAHMALGLQAESSKKIETAMRHYKEALGSYMDDWMAYEFSLERIKKLKLKTDDPEN